MAGRGKPKTGGRRAGTKNKVTVALKDAILGAFDKAGGEAWLLELAQKDPRTFATLLSRLIPRELEARINGGEGLAERILAARKRARDHGHEVGQSPR